MAEQGNAEPIFEASLGGISVSLPLLGSEHALLSERQSAVLERLRSAGGPMRVSDLAEALGVSVRTVQNELVATESLGLVSRLGRGKAVRWTDVR
jgi:DNA-binding MarR family transcriptional regulator